MTPNEILSQLFYGIIAIFSLLIALEFYHSRNGKLRILIIALFLCKLWVYGGSMVYHFLLDYNQIHKLDRIYIQLILNFPMVVVMVQLWGYIRNYKKKDAS